MLQISVYIIYIYIHLLWILKCQWGPATLASGLRPSEISMKPSHQSCKSLKDLPAAPSENVMAPWHTMAYHRISWPIMAYHGIPWPLVLLVVNWLSNPIAQLAVGSIMGAAWPQAAADKDLRNDDSVTTVWRQCHNLSLAFSLVTLH